MAKIKRQDLAKQERCCEPARLGGLADAGLDVFCWCNRCGHNAVMSTVQLIGQLGANTAVPEIGVHMRCTGCGSRDIATRPHWPSPGRITRHN